MARPIIGLGAQTLNKKKLTILGHLQQPLKCLRSTQEKDIHSEPDPEQDQFPPSTHSEDNNTVFFKIVDLSGKIYTDQTGRFPVISSKGNKYILAAYHYDSNTIYANSKDKIIPGLSNSVTETLQLIDQQRLDTTPAYPRQ